jgi:hypothetical protein
MMIDLSDMFQSFGYPDLLLRPCAGGQPAPGTLPGGATGWQRALLVPSVQPRAGTRCFALDLDLDLQLLTVWVALTVASCRGLALHSECSGLLGLHSCQPSPWPADIISHIAALPQVHRGRLLHTAPCVTLTPRQRITAHREVVHLRSLTSRTAVEEARMAAMSSSYEYDGEQTCAADGMCKEKCSVKVSTGSQCCSRQGCAAGQRCVNVIAVWGRQRSRPGQLLELCLGCRQGCCQRVSGCCNAALGNVVLLL